MSAVLTNRWFEEELKKRFGISESELKRAIQDTKRLRGLEGEVFSASGNFRNYKVCLGGLDKGQGQTFRTAIDLALNARDLKKQQREDYRRSVREDWIKKVSAIKE